MPALIKPFRALRPAPGRADDVAAPPYDVLNFQEAHTLAQDKPWSFLHISRPEIDLGEAVDPYSEAVYIQGARNLERMVSEQILIRDPAPAYYVYRLSLGEHHQTGLAFVGAVAEYQVNRIRKHELTRPKKETDRVRQISALNAQTGPVLVTFRHNERLREILSEASAASPLYDVVGEDNVGHAIWKLDDAELIRELSDIFEGLNALYIADGHHRSAAAARVAQDRRSSGSEHAGEPSWDYFLCVGFADDEMRILDYNRVVRDLNGMEPGAFVSAIAANFSVEPADTPVRPAATGEFGLYLPDQWYRLKIRPDLVPDNDPVGSLDVSLLQNHLIAPLLNIQDPRTDERIDFVGGIRGLEGLKKRVDSGEMAAAFSLFPTRMQALMDVADAEQVMPPKSTWFEPKLADGLLSHVLD